ncbi:protein RST1 isoform X2 [Tripterygium wilfordii]|nr:protein RST1 isoform X2 [Tripterygium wilfordii]
MASFCCSFPFEAMPVLKLLINLAKIFPHNDSEACSHLKFFLECIVVTYTVVLKRLAEAGLVLNETQLCGVELLETILALFVGLHKQDGGSVAILELVKRLLVVQKDIELRFTPELSSTTLSLFVILIKSEFEHEQLSLLKLLLFLLNWKSEEHAVGLTKSAFCEELLFIFPVINLMSSPSKSVKGVATDLLAMIEKLLVKFLTSPVHEVSTEVRSRSIGSPGSIAFRLLQCLWFQDQHSLYSSFFFHFASSGKSGTQVPNVPSSWTSQIKEYSLWIADRRKSSIPISQSQENFRTEMPLFLSAVNSVLVMHQSWGTTALDSLASLGLLDPKLGVSLLLTFLFYNKIFIRKEINNNFMLPKLLGMLPSLASHFVMIPLIVQTILPMLHKDTKPVLYATAIRLLCQTWAVNDRAFGSLQAVLLPKGPIDSVNERTIIISMAASIRDVCKKNPDRGVDLILPVETCIESKDPVVQSLGIQGLAHLCEADVIDFYTAWDVIAKHVLDYSTEPRLAYSLCFLLRWGAMDAEVYPEVSKKVLHILWGVGSAAHLDYTLQWEQARASAFEALCQYEVPHIDMGIPDVKERITELIFSEKNPHVLGAMEGFLVKIATHEHINRRRFVKEKRVPGSKIEKLLDVLPQVLFSSGKDINAASLPGAALLCLSFTPKYLTKQGVSRGLGDVHSEYENALVEIAASLQLSRNIFVALLSLQSWKSFMRRWMRANTLSLDAKVTPITLDKTSRAANDIMKRIIRLAEACIPRSAENMALAIGALCAILPPSSHAIKSTASKFLLNWLFQYEHEHRQWSAALSLGLISSCLHVTDHKQKFQNINGLLEVLCGSKSTLVKGACGVGLGFSCQDLLTGVEAADKSDLDKETYKMQAVATLGNVVRTFLLMMSQLSQASHDILDDLSIYFPRSSHDIDSTVTPELFNEFNDEDLEEDIWGAAGLILGLGSSIGALYRAGAVNAVLKIKDLVISWIPPVDSVVKIYGSCSKGSEKVLAVGSCLALPTVVSFCQRVELLNDNEIDHLLNRYQELISGLMSVNEYSTFHQSLLMTSCIGGGNFLACILNEGVHFIAAEQVRDLLELFRKCYSSAHPPLVHLGGMLGVINALGAGAGIFTYGQHSSPSLKTGYEQKKKSSYVVGPLLSSPFLESYLTELMQEIFLVAQNPNDVQLRQYAAWAVSLLRYHLQSKEVINANDDEGIQTDVSGSKMISHGFSEDSVVMKLCLWLMNLNFSEANAVALMDTVFAVLRCLSQAPRLPTMEWGSIIRRCMKYEAQIIMLLPADSIKQGVIREECLKFSIAHANQFDSLLNFLDELSDLSRFKTLQPNLQSCLLFHLAALTKMFSDSRLEKLFVDVASYFASDGSYEIHDLDKKMMLRLSCWRGLRQCLDEASLDSLSYISNIEKCMQVLFSSLPAPQSPGLIVVDKVKSSEEWFEAIRCLAKARHSWLSDFLQVSHVDLEGREGPSAEVLKMIQAKAKLVGIGSLPLTELGKLKAYILNSKPHGMWDVLVEIVAALQLAEGSVKRQWLVDVVEISCVSSYPTTALWFLGLLAGSCCRYMPLLILDQDSVLSDLPVTLTSLLREPSWEVIADAVVSSLLTSTERVYSWSRKVALGDDTPNSQPIDESENDMTAFLLQVMHHVCLSLKDHLPLEKQLWLANISAEV